MSAWPAPMTKPWMLLGALLAAAPVSAATLYSVSDLGDLGGVQGAGAVALNGAGLAAGYSFLPSGAVHAMLNRKGMVLDLGTLGGAQSLARAVNSHGEVVGWAYRAGESIPRAFRWRAGQMTDLGTFGGARSDASDINDGGRIVGSAFDALGRERAFLWEAGTLTDLGTLGGSQARAYALNEQGDVVGMAATEFDDRFHAFLAKPGLPMMDLGTLGGFTSHAYDINEAAQVCGWTQLSPAAADSRGFLWNAGTLKSIGTLGGVYSAAFGLNDAGDVVGASTRADGSLAAVLWRDNELLELDQWLVPGSGWTVLRAWDIDEQGVIVGEGRLGNGPTRAVLLVPVATADVPVSGPRSLAFAGAHPNPLRGTSQLRFTLPAADDIQLDIHDVRGARVRALASGWRAAGEHAEPWDGRDDGGKVLAPGLYWASLSVGERRLTRRVVVAR